MMIARRALLSIVRLTAGCLRLTAGCVLLTAGCQDETTPGLPPIELGLLLSYSGSLAANSTNSERALRLAVEQANAAGGIGGRRLAVFARDTRSDPLKVSASARQLKDRHVALIVGPDTSDTAVELLGMLDDETLIMPSFTTAHANFRRPVWWFVMGAGTARVACELHAQMALDHRKNPVMLSDPNDYNALIGWEMTRHYGMPQLLLPRDQASNTDTVQPILNAEADAYVVAAQPQAASSLIYAMAALGALGDGSHWYLSPTLHTPAFLATIPTGALMGARGVAPGTMAGAAPFRTAFEARWQDGPLDDAYAFYDAGAIAVLALARSMAREGNLAVGSHLGQHVSAVTHAGGEAINWNELDKGIRLLDEGKEIEYLGLSGLIEFDLTGQTPKASARWWTLTPDGFKDAARLSECSENL